MNDVDRRPLPPHLLLAHFGAAAGSMEPETGVAAAADTMGSSAADAAGGGEDEDFRFDVVAPGGDNGDAASLADEIFYRGRILPVYPVFDRHLLDDAALDLDTAPPPPPSVESVAAAEEGVKGEYCVWTPSPRSAPASPGRVPKSSSTGTATTGRWRLRDILGAGRSTSDGKEKFLFMAPTPPGDKQKAAKKQPAGKKDLVSAHKEFYGERRTSAAANRSYLPYVGLFGNVGLLRRSQHPF